MPMQIVTVTGLRVTSCQVGPYDHAVSPRLCCLIEDQANEF
jgi:hypothetical protein